MNETRNTPADVVWKPAGTGLAIQRLCLGCDGKRSISGGRGVGARWRCVQCVAKRETV